LPALQRRDRYGFWFSMQQQLFGEAANGKFLNGGAFFLNVTFTDHRTSAIDDQVAAGFWWKGIIPALPDDVLGIGVAAKLDWLEIRWPQPRGRTERYTDLPVDRYTTIVEGTGNQGK